MAIYRYTKGLLGPKVKGFDNKNQFYNIRANDYEVSIYTKKGKILCKANVSDENHVIIHAKDDFIAVQNYNKTIRESRIAIFKNNELIKNTALYGKIEEIIFGAEDVYFMKFLFNRANRLYYQLINDDGKIITPEWQIIQHEVDKDGKDNFYCENYKEISDDEMRDESTEKILQLVEELEEMAIYNSKGERIFHQSYIDEDIPRNGRISITKNKEFNESLVLYDSKGKEITEMNEVITNENKNEGLELE